MKILREGDAGVALARGRGRVPVVYRYRDYSLDSGVRVRNLLVGIDDETDEVLVIPAQSSAKIRAARTSKDKTVEARISAELEDVVALIADRYGANTSKVGPAIVRYYIARAAGSERLCERLRRLASAGIANEKRRVAWKIRMGSAHATWLDMISEQDDTITQSDIVRAILVAAKEDVLDHPRSSRRKREVEAAALAV